MSFARESWPFVLPLLVVAILAAVIGQFGWASAMGVLTLAVLLFFRIPKRSFDGNDELEILSPADGRILKIDRIDDDEVGPGNYHRIVIFLSVFNVHVQRSPVDGRIVTSRYTPGRKLAAFDKRAGDVNEQLLTVLERDSGDRVGVRQIAGLLARRVVTYMSVEQQVRRGDLIGLIKFGSRVDLLVPLGYDVRVAKGQRVREGRTVVALTTLGEPR